MKAFNPLEAGHEDSYRLLEQLREDARPMIEPGLLLPEVAAAVAQGRDDGALAREFSANIARLPHLVLVALDMPLAQQAVEVAAQHRPRTSDAAYAAVALRFGCVLLTRDREQRERVAGGPPTFSPVEALAAYGG